MLVERKNCMYIQRFGFDKLDFGIKDSESNENLFNFVIINLAYIEKYMNKYPKDVISFLKLIRSNDQREMKILSKENKLNEQIYRKMQEISEDDSLVSLIDTYEMSQLDDDLRSLSDKRENKIEGKIEGRIETAINLFDILDDETISNKISIDINLVKKLRANYQNDNFDIKDYLQ